MFMLVLNNLNINVQYCIALTKNCTYIHSRKQQFLYGFCLELSKTGLFDRAKCLRPVQDKIISKSGNKFSGNF